MNVVQQIHAHLAPVTPPGDIHHIHNRKSPPVFPFVLTQIIAAPINNSLRGESDLQNYVFQIDVFALTVREAKNVASFVSSQMANFKPSSVRTDMREEYEEGVKAYRISQDFSVWSRD